MKKLATIILALILCACFACASGEGDPAVTDMPVAGLKLAWPKALAETKGTVAAEGAYDLEDGVWYAYWYYCAASPEETARLMQDNPQALKSEYLFYTFSVAENKPVADVVRKLNQMGLSITEADMIPVGSADAWHFYLCMAHNKDFAAGVEPEYAQEYEALCGLKDEIAAGFTCSVPFNEYGDLTNRVVRFEGTDLDGNPVSSAELFSKNKVTLANIWATWCGPCVGELADLQAIHARNVGKGGAVVGILVDNNLEEARRLVKENGITYPIVVVPQSFAMAFPFSAYPTTFYVDSNGTFLETKFTGAYPDMYEGVLESYLK